MKIYTYLALAGLGLTASAQAAEHRLAYSEANQLQVFIEHADDQPWCSESLHLRFSDSGGANQKLLEQMMPRIGALLERECPAARELSWRSVDASDQVLVSGTSSATGGWVLTIPASRVMAESAVAEAPAPEAAQATVPAAVAEVLTVAPPETEEAKEIAVEPVAESEPVATAAAAVPAESTAPGAIRPAVAEVAGVPAAASGEEALSFVVAGWRPRSSEQTLAATEFSTPLRDQDNCLFHTNLSLDTAPEYLRIRSEGVSCDANGLASGEGTLQISRSDGAGLGSITGDWHQGIAFVGGKPDFTLQHVNQEQAVLFGLLGSDPASMTHYLIEASAQRNGAWSLQNPRVIVLTSNLDSVRETDAIQEFNQRVMRDVAELADRHTSTVRILVVSSLDETFNGKRQVDDSWLYQTELSRSWNGTWSVRGYGTTNHLFEREARQARELAQAQARERLQREQQMRQEARAQERYLQTFQSLNQKPLEQRVNEWISEPTARQYLQLMQGEKFNYQQIVRITGKHSDGGWQVSEPYDAVLYGNDALDKGWYRVVGQLALDPDRLDKQKLPSSLIQSELVTPCRNKGCEELFEPAGIVAAMAGQPDWSEEKARHLIERVQNGQFD